MRSIGVRVTDALRPPPRPRTGAAAGGGGFRVRHPSAFLAFKWREGFMATQVKLDRGGTVSAPPADHPSAAAEAAGLRYVTDGSPGFRRRRSGRGFVYVDRRGKRVRNPHEL